MRWACWRARRAWPVRTAKSCGPDLPTLGSSLAVSIRKATVAKKPGTPRRARISRQTNRAGNAGCFGVPVVTCLRAFLSCTQGCGCVRCTGIPCALFFVRDEIDASLGRKTCRGNADARFFRHCEPTGRANARPMTGSAKRSRLFPRMQSGLLRRFAPRNDVAGAV